MIDVLSKEKLSGKVLDLGCGYGVIGIVLNTLFPNTQITAADINPRAIELAKINGERNQSLMKTVLSDGFENISEQFDFIVTNPPIRAGKKVIYQMFEESYAHLRPNGCIYVVIRKAQGAESAKRKLEAVYHNCEVIQRKSGYWVLKSTH